MPTLKLCVHVYNMPAAFVLSLFQYMCCTVKPVNYDHPRGFLLLGLSWPLLYFNGSTSAGCIFRCCLLGPNMHHSVLIILHEHTEVHQLKPICVVYGLSTTHKGSHNTHTEKQGLFQIIQLHGNEYDQVKQAVSDILNTMASTALKSYLNLKEVK